MADMDFDKIEEELGLVIPRVYRMFIDAVNANGHDLQRFHIYYNTQSVVEGNRQMRKLLAEEDPPWKNEYFDFGVGDGCGNYYFLRATERKNDQVEIWCHDPHGIEDGYNGTDFFAALLEELEAEFMGPGAALFQGHGFLD